MRMTSSKCVLQQRHLLGYESEPNTWTLTLTLELTLTLTLFLKRGPADDLNVCLRNVFGFPQVQDVYFVCFVFVDVLCFMTYNCLFANPN